MGVNKKRGPSDVAGTVEDEQALVPLVGHFEDPKPKLATAFLPLPVAQDHDLLRREVAETLEPGARILGNRETDMLRRVDSGMSRRCCNKTGRQDRDRGEVCDPTGLHVRGLQASAIPPLPCKDGLAPVLRWRLARTRLTTLSTGRPEMIR